MQTFVRPASPEDLDELVAIDDDACALYATAGLHLDLAPDHPFVRAERARWLRAARDGLAYLAGPPGVPALAMMVLGFIDGACHLEQLSVRLAAMRQGIGSALLGRAIAWAARRPIWLTTYAHLAWNRPFYERVGFEVLAEGRCPPGIVAILEEERRWLPAPAQRVAMRRGHL